MSIASSRLRPRLSALIGGAALAVAAAMLLPSAACSGGESTTAGNAGGGGASSSSSSSSAVCGDGACSHDDGEYCDACPEDCGECPACGNGQCEIGTGDESCDSCEEDCGACSPCGDGTCDVASSETCDTCVDDCGACDSCGDGTCDEAESCESCEADCGACDLCGDGECDAGIGEKCSNCAEDCGACDTCGNGICDAGETCTSCSKDCGTCERKGCVQGDFKAYFGGLHAHTHVSDGKGTSAEAFNHAKNVTKPGFDFMWLSDHRNGITPTEWSACRAAANKYNEPGKFAAGCGFEKWMREPGKSNGHLNMLFVDKLLSPIEPMNQVYKQLGECVPCVGQFNHPGSPGTPNKWAYDADAKDAIRLIEFNGGESFAYKLDAYFKALDSGWSISPSFNEDNHNKGWGDTSRATIVWAPELTRTGIRNSVRANRTSATDDDTSRLKMVADDECWMGSHLEGGGETTIKVELRDTQAGDTFDAVRFYGPKQALLATRDCKNENPCFVTYSFKVTKKTFVVAVSRQKDQDFIVSAPIWFEP